MKKFDVYFKRLAFNSISVPNSIKNNPYLNGNDMVIYSQLLFRLRLSIQQGSKFFNKRFNQYYLIYQINELNQALSFSKNTIIRSLKRLENLGFIFRLKLYHRTLIFMPKVTKLANNSHFIQKSRGKSNTELKSEVRTQNGIYSKEPKMVSITKSNKENENKVCVNKPVKSPKKSNNKLVKAFRSNWNTSNNDVIKLNQLSNDFSTKLILKAIKITKYKEFKTTPLNFITGVIRRLVLEAKKSKQKPKKIRPRRMFRTNRLKKKQPNIKVLTKFYDPELVSYAIKLAKESHKVIYNRFNYISGILFRFKKLGITTVTAAKAYEIQPNYNNSYSQNQLHKRDLTLKKLTNWGKRIDEQQSRFSKENIMKMKKQYHQYKIEDARTKTKKRAAKREAMRKAKLVKAKKAKEQIVNAKARRVAISKISGILGTC